MLIEMTGAKLITEERIRQQRDPAEKGFEGEGYDSHHDQRHTDKELARAALAYLLEYAEPRAASALPPGWWPWRVSDWKPTEDKVRQLAKSGALIAAEIDRLLVERGQSAEGSGL
jgi:hypothetical protein